MTTTRIGMVMFPGFTQLDLTGPHEVWSRVAGAEVVLVAAARGAVRSESGLELVAAAGFEEAQGFDVLFVPGGPGVNAAMEDEGVLGFLRAQGAGARWITSVCTGSLVLGAAGLLDGYRATTHWLSLELLTPFGAVAVGERVVVDRNRITGGGVTAGIDFGLRVAAEIAGRRAAEEIQLLLEYAPAPPFAAGSPGTAPREVVEGLIDRRRAFQEERGRIVERAAARLRRG